MIDPLNVPDIDDGEQLARFVTQKGQFRSSNRTVTQNLFVPPNTSAELSVVRHRETTQVELWQIGQNVASDMGRELLGRTDLVVAEVRQLFLDVVKSPLPLNPNHADIIGWPAAREDRKAIAIKLARIASNLIEPN